MNGSICGGVCGFGVEPAAWDPVEARWEASIDRAVAERIIPADELAVWASGRAEVGWGATVRDLADEFEVSEHVATVRVQILTPAT